MKNLGFVAISLLVTSFLSKCGGGKSYTVTFDTDGGSLIEPVRVIANAHIKKPNDPIKEPLTEICYTFKEWQLDGNTFDFNTRIKSDITLKAIYTESTRLYTVSFDSDGGTLVDPILTEYNTTITPPEDPSKESSPEFSYEFKEWQLDGETFSFATPIKEDITLKAKWTETTRQYTVYFDSDGGTPVNPITTDYNTTIDEPTDPTKEDDIWIYSFLGWFKDDGEEFDFATPIVGDITLTAKWDQTEKKTYLANANDTSHLVFTTREGEQLQDYEIEAGKGFVFKMETINESNDSRYVVPTVLDIRVKSEEAEPLVEGYHIEPDHQRTNAIVTIDASKIVGDIFITGKAVLEGNYHYDVPYVYGLEEIESGEVTDIQDDLILTFTPKTGTEYQLPQAENIYVQFDNVEEAGYKKKWVSPADEDVQEEYCNYNSTTGQLTIKPNHIRNNILIVARSHNYKLLDSLTWEEINDISFRGLAPLAFYVGEEKNITIKDQTGKVDQEFSHTIRIIGFNHDKINGSTAEEPEYAKITFEFTNVVTNYGGAFDLLWNTYETRGFPNPTSFDYPNSTLNDYLNKGTEDAISIYSRFPSDLRKYIKTVDKYVMTSTNKGQSWSEKEYKTRLFPLSAIEMSENVPSYVSVGEGKTYQYYIEHKEDVDRFKKMTAEGSGISQDDHSYWLRSPTTNSGSIDNAVCIYHDGKTLTNDFAHSYVYNYRLHYGVAPCFCI